MLDYYRSQPALNLLKRHMGFIARHANAFTGVAYGDDPTIMVRFQTPTSIYVMRGIYMCYANRDSFTSIGSSRASVAAHGHTLLACLCAG